MSFPKLIFPFAVLASLGLHGAVLMLPLEEKPEEEEVVEEELIEDVPIAILDVPSNVETKQNKKKQPLPIFSSPSPKTVPNIQPQPVKKEVVTKPTEVETVPDLDKKDDSPDNKSNKKEPISSDSEENNEDDPNKQNGEGDEDDESDDSGSGEEEVDVEAENRAKQFVDNFTPNDSRGDSRFFTFYITAQINPLKVEKKNKENDGKTPREQIKELENQILEIEKQVKIFFPSFDQDQKEVNWFEDKAANIINIGVVPEKTLKKVFEEDIVPQLEANGSDYEKKDEGYAGGDLYQIKGTNYYISIVQLKGPGKLVLWAYLDKSPLE
ncbi:MAG: hypothetical protein WA896_23585 [Spirulinaceae cyanobacterium]